MAKIVEEFGNKVRELRKSKGLSQEKLAEKAGLHYTYIGAVERGEKNISLQNVEKIAHALGVDITKLFTFIRQTRKNYLFKEIVNLLSSRRPKELEVVSRVVNALFEK